MLIEVRKAQIEQSRVNGLSCEPITKAIKAQTGRNRVFARSLTITIDDTFYACDDNIANWIIAFEAGEDVKEIIIELNDEFNVAYLRDIEEYDKWIDEYFREQEEYQADRFAAYEPCGVEF